MSSISDNLLCQRSTTCYDVADRRQTGGPMTRIRTPADLGAAIREHRRRRDLDQMTLAERVGVSRQWLLEVEKGKPGAALGTVLRTLDALGMTLRLDDEPPTARPRRRPAADIDAIVARARGRRS